MASKVQLCDYLLKANWEVLGTEMYETDPGPPPVEEERVRAYNRVTGDEFFGTMADFNAIFQVPFPPFSDEVKVSYSTSTGLPEDVKDDAGRGASIYEYR